MSYFEVRVNGTNILDPTDKKKVLINPVVKISVEEAGSFEFTLDPSNQYYNSITPYASDIEVFEDGKSIFFGRALPPSINMWNQKTYHCEGALAFLNDVILKPMSQFVVPDFTSDDSEDPDFTSDDAEVDEHNGLVQRTINLSDYLNYVFSEYNRLQTKSSRRLSWNGTTIGRTIPYSTDYKSCLEVLRGEILPYTGGYLIAARTGGSTIVNLKLSFPASGGQPITAGANLLDFVADGQPFYTACIGKGGKVKDTETGEMVDVEMTDPVTISAASTYGVICAYKSFPDALDVGTLTSLCASFLAEQQFNNLVFDVDALDLHITNREYSMLQIGQSVAFRSPKHGINASVVVSGLEIHLDTGEKRVTLGTRERGSMAVGGSVTYKRGTSMTSIVNSQVSEVRNKPVEVLPYDIKPTEDSANPVTSGGIYQAMQEFAPKDNWIHQVDGVTQSVGIVNFITT